MNNEQYCSLFVAHCSLTFMLNLSAKTRKNAGEKLNSLRKEGKLPAVVYGPEVESLPIVVDYKEFKKVFTEAGETTLVNLKIEDAKKEYPVLIYDTQEDPLTNKFLHVDFYQAPLKEEIEATVPLIFEGESPAVKDLEGTLIRNITEIEVKALPQNIPHEIKVDISRLQAFEDHILVKDLTLPSDVKTLREPDEIVASVAPPEEVEEELEKPIEEKVEEVEKVGEGEEEGKKEEEEEEKREEGAGKEKPGQEKQKPQEKK